VRRQFFKQSGLAALAGLAWLGLCTGPASAADSQDNATQLNAVIVSAQKVRQDLVKVPVSVTALDSEQIEDLGVDNLRDLPAFVPNLNMQKFGAHHTEFNYRGIGGVTTMSKTWNVNIDGATLPYVGLDSLYDVERIEVLRGGQGALYGRNTNAGVINVFTPQPSHTPEGKADATYGSFGEASFKGALGGPINEVWSYRVAGWRTSSDGFITNDVSGKDDADGSWQDGLHLKLRAEPDSRTDITLAAILDEYRGAMGWTNMAGGRTYHSQSDESGRDKGGLTTGMLTVNRDMDLGRFTSVTAYSQSRYKILMDMDASPAALFNLDYKEEFSTLTHEMRLASPENNGAWRWLGGMFLLHEDVDYDTGGTGAFATGASTASTGNNAASAFGQLGWRFLPDWELTGGLRLGYERQAFKWRNTTTGADYALTKGWTSILPSLSLAWEFTRNQTAYASVSRGSRSGDFTANETNTTTLRTNPVVAPEYSLTYEVGYKAELFDHSLRLSTAAFNIIWDDMQVTAITAGGLQSRQNAAKSHSRGLEAEVQWLPVAGLTLFGQGGVMNAKFDEYKPMASGDPTGKRIPNTAEFSLGSGLIYQHPSGFFLGFDATRFGTKYLDEMNTLKQDPYTLVNAKLGYKAEHWHAALVGKNLGDERYVVRAFQFMPGLAPSVMAAPLSVGVELGASF